MCESMRVSVNVCVCESMCVSVNVSVCESMCVRKCECACVCESMCISVNVSVFVCMCVRERERPRRRHTDLNAKRGSLGAVGMEGISEADPCLVRPEAYTILEPCKLVMKDSICLGDCKLH